MLGASGTAGAELVRLLWDHPRVTAAFHAAHSTAGATLDSVDPGAPAVPLVHPDDIGPDDAELVFLSLPHGASAAQAARFHQGGCRVVDLSGDLRLRDEQLHDAVYGTPRDPDVARAAVYGLTEFAREAVRGSRLVSNPGCYTTCAELALGPLYERGLVHDLPIIDAKSGISGAGRSPSPGTHYLAVAGDVRPYKLGREHRHVAEIEQTLQWLHPTDAPQRVVFNPHVVAMDRGILSTIVVRGLDLARAREALSARYRGEPFVDLLAPGQAARVAMVRGTNRTVVSAHDVAGTDAVVLASALDNLVKGAAGQAIQNMNLMLGLPETSGLPGACWGDPARREA